ncbi:ECF transporter S component [Anaerotignum sp. MB30-C6]|uniref:ECF transporter S component n=1 Tax=Anaerotignum sp. MB30-C6 TaxID=3070814 RepID=UPI0027DE0ADD|nr:ECF transporter S component [Anaerotignum sp. MB30-C6]WMI80268.1 ECF transporter S component [Anaerotignum sp. MB30-C6]
MKTKQLVLTALLLAMCIIFQSLKGISVYLTGSAVNAMLVMATLAVGTSSGVFIAVITPFIAYLMGQTPIMQMVPLMVIVIMVGNLALVLLASVGRRGKLPAWLAAGATLKAVVLWLLVWYAILPFFGDAVPEKMVAVIKTTFSITQFITAVIGCVIAYMIHARVQHLYFAQEK